MSNFNRDEAERWANKELERDETGWRIPRLADCDWPKEWLRRALDEIDRLNNETIRDQRQITEAARADAKMFRAERDQLRAELDRLNKYIATHDEEYLAMKDVLRAEHQACVRMRPVFEIAQRWCTRPESVLREGAQVLANDAEMWRKLRAAISSTLTPADGSGT